VGNLEPIPLFQAKNREPKPGWMTSVQEHMYMTKKWLQLTSSQVAYSVGSYWSA